MGLGHEWGGGGLSVWVPVGAVDTHYLLIEVHDGRVVHASIRDAEGEDPKIPDAPPDF
jgi:hypothetical protein